MAVEHILKSEHDFWGKPSLLTDDSPRFFLYPVCTRAPDISHESPARRLSQGEPEDETPAI